MQLYLSRKAPRKNSPGAEGPSELRIRGSSSGPWLKRDECPGVLSKRCRLSGNRRHPSSALEDKNQIVGKGANAPARMVDRIVRSGDVLTKSLGLATVASAGPACGTEPGFVRPGFQAPGHRSGSDRDFHICRERMDDVDQTARCPSKRVNTIVTARVVEQRPLNRVTLAAIRFAITPARLFSICMRGGPRFQSLGRRRDPDGPFEVDGIFWRLECCQR